jgi:predicted nucleic acid-binding Zn ribbon protein
MLDELGLGAAQRAVEIDARWGQSVGPEAARHSRPALLRNGVLEVEVDSSVWSQELGLRKPQILATLRREFGDDAPRDLRFRLA